MSKQKNARKMILRVFIVVFAVLLGLCIILGALALVDHFLKKGKTHDPDDLTEPDYSANIFEDEAYNKLNRAVYYLEYGNGEELNETNYDRVGIASEFFYHYFDAIIRGQADVYRSMLTDEYVKSNDVPERFTMQRLYDIRVDQCQSVSKTTYHGAETGVYYFEVQYKIYKNDGTFRDDIGSNQAITQYYELYFVNNRFYLNAVSTKKVVKR